MTLLRQRMLDALLLRGMAIRTQEAYIDAVARLARHYRRSPDTLTADEVRHYLLHLLRERHLSHSSVNQYGCAYRFVYGTGLRLSELCRLRVSDIDSHADRMCIRIEQGKGAKDRYVPLAEDVLQLLRQWWHSAHPRVWLFGALRDPSRPMDGQVAQR